MTPNVSAGAGLLPTARSDHAEPSVFQVENLLREARRQRGATAGSVPPLCLLDPDGDIVRHLQATGRAARSSVWACDHTDFWKTTLGKQRPGVVDCAVGAPFAVLVAEQLFASGCQLLISITSAGQIAADLDPPCLILIERALRGEGTSYCYLPPATLIEADAAVLRGAARGLAGSGVAVRHGMAWTTDAPYRETKQAIKHARAAGTLAVEMEAAALCALSRAKGLPIVCFAHVTNQMAQGEGDFEKGPGAGAEEALRVVAASVWPIR